LINVLAILINNSFEQRVMKKSFAVLLIILGFHSPIFGQQPAIYINEFMASNVSTFADIVDFADFSDWIEIYNDQSISVDISGYFITDNLSNPYKWQIPENTVIPAKGFYLLWADDFDDEPGKTYIRDSWPGNIEYTTIWSHTNFKLNKDGEEIGFYNPNGEIIDSIVFGKQIDDVSFGRKPDGSENWFFFGEPTPMLRNETEGILNTQYSATTLFSKESGFYSSPIQVELSSSNQNGDIHYTLDGSIPTSQSSKYQSAISISKNTVLTARIFDSDKLAGKVVGKSYFINEERNLPAFSIAADSEYLMGKELGIYKNSLKEREIPINFEYFSLFEADQFSSRVGMRIGGENIYRFAQKPLNIYARANYGESQIEYPMFEHLPYQSYKRLYLRNSGDDWPYTMFRDGLIVSILRDEIDNSVQAYRPSVLYLNGEYWGIYNLREKLDQQYFSLHYNTSASDLDHLEYNGTIIEGDNTDYLSLIDLASTLDLSEPSNYNLIASQIDINNLMDFVITQSYISNSSWSHNREVWRDRGGDNKWRWVLVDMDRGLNVKRLSTNLFQNIYEDFGLFNGLMNNESFKNKFIQRNAERLYTTFDQDRSIQIIDSLQQQIEPEINRHISKWGTFIDSLSITDWGETAGISSLDEWNSEVDNYRSFVREREGYVIQNLASEFELEGQSELKISSNPSNKGNFRINDFFKAVGDVGRYFNNIPLQIEAVPPPGYSFISWKIIESGNTITQLIPTGGNWNYLYGTSELSNEWIQSNFDDSNWQVGPAILGYGDNQNTLLDFGNDASNKPITAYFRKTFEVNDPTNIELLKFQILRDDGAIVYLNGTELIRSNMPTGNVESSTEALSTVSGGDEDSYFNYEVEGDDLVTGFNVLAVEIHQINASSSDLSFDLGLKAVLAHQVTDTSIVSFSQNIELLLSLDTELIMEFEETNVSFLPDIISSNQTLIAENAPYYVNQDVTIATGATLIVEEGVDIFISEGKKIEVLGVLEMIGTENSPIILDAFYAGTQWAGVFFKNNTAPSLMKFVEIKNAKGIENDAINFGAISLENASLEMYNVNISKVRFPISSQKSRLRIENSSIKNGTMVGDYLNVNAGKLWVINTLFEGNNIEDMDAIDIGFMNDTTIIEGNIFRNFEGENSDAIDIGDQSEAVLVKGNFISNCGDKAISVGQASTVLIERNLIWNCNLGVGIKDLDSFAQITNNTFYENDVAVAAYEKILNRGGGTAFIKNSIFENSFTNDIIADEFSTITVDYSVSNTTILDGVQNLFDDIKLINPGQQNFYPQVVSPLIDSGDPESLPDDDGSISDIGAFSYQHFNDYRLVINELNYNSEDNFDPEDWIELYNASDEALDISNWVLLDESGEQTFVFDTDISILPNSYLVIARETKRFHSLFDGVSDVYGDLKTGFSSNGESLYLYSIKGKLMDSLKYSDKAPWPIEADGQGATLELVNPFLDNSVATSWSASTDFGTPGKVNSSFLVSNDINFSSIPNNVALLQNYPNPFNPNTVLSYQTPDKRRVSLRVFDLLGRDVITLVNEVVQAGYHQVTFDASRLSSGVYIYRLEAGNQVFTKKMTLIK